MYEALISTLAGEFSGARCLRDVARYWQFRCTVPGPALAAASEFICQRHQEHGVQARVIAYPADDRTEWFGHRRSPLAWYPRAARLAVVGRDGTAERVCDYADEPLCLASNSTGTPAGGVTAPLVVVAQADHEEGYSGVDVQGRVILVDRPVMNVDQLARQRGAVGVISDGIAPAWLAQYPPVRVAADAPDLTLWSILSGRRAQRGLWGFNLTPRQGASLRRRLADADGDLLVHAAVDAELAEGTSEVVEAVLPGTDLAAEEIWVLAHSSEPGARDNASGCCVGIELARALRHLTTTGRLAPLRRTVRFLNGVEVDGFVPYLHDRQADLGRLVAGLCLDGLGMDCALAGGSLLAFRSPETDASFVDGLIAVLCATVADTPAEVFGGDPYELFAWDSAPFWGNDAFLARGFFDVPTPQLSCWPDRYYHSSLDTIAQMSAGALARAATIAGAYLHVLATAGPTEAGGLAQLAARDWKRRIIDALDQPGTSRPAEEVNRMARHMGYQATDAIMQVLRLAPDAEGLQHQTRRLAAAVRDFAQREGDAAVDGSPSWGAPEAARAADPRPIGTCPGAPAAAAPGDEPTDGRAFRRVVWHRPDAAAWSPAARDRLAALQSAPGQVDRAWHWLNGRRTVAEVWERLQVGGVVAFPVVQAYLQLLEDEGLVTQGPR